MFHSMVDRHTYLAGASGGVYALIGAHIAVTVMVSVKAGAQSCGFHNITPLYF